MRQDMTGSAADDFLERADRADRRSVCKKRPDFHDDTSWWRQRFLVGKKTDVPCRDHDYDTLDNQMEVISVENKKRQSP